MWRPSSVMIGLALLPATSRKLLSEESEPDSIGAGDPVGAVAVVVCPVTCVSVALIPNVAAFNNEAPGLADAADGEIVPSGRRRAAVRAAALAR